MKNFWISFVKRGMVAAWGGPAILCIVWACLWHADTMQKLEKGEAILSVASSLVMAFIAGGISVIYQLEQLPKAMAALIQMAVLYVDYLGIYLLNGWLPLNAIPVFTLIFAVGFAAIWAMIYLYVKRTVSDLNEKIKR